MAVTRPLIPAGPMFRNFKFSIKGSGSDSLPEVRFSGPVWAFANSVVPNPMASAKARTAVLLIIKQQI
jgi:hypothetical protein